MRLWPLAVLALVLAGLLSPARGESESGDAQVRQAVARSLGFLEKEGGAWMRERGCVSCHTVTFLIWSHNEAGRRGLPVDKAKLAAWTDWSLVNMLARGKEGGGLDTMSQMLLARDRSSTWRSKPSRHLKTVDPYETLWQYVLERQAADGSWAPEGQLTSPPEVTTRWALLALASRDTPAAPASPGEGPGQGVGPALAGQLKKIDDGLGPARQRALAWLEKTPPDGSTEALLLRFLVEAKIGRPERATFFRTALLSRQRGDGGWAYRSDGLKGDAFATGQALYALGEAGVAADHPAVRRARAFLLRTQRPDGSWFVATSSIHPVSKERTEGTDQIYTYWGSAWASIGLSHTLPAQPKAGGQAG